MLHRANLIVLALVACLFLSSNTCQYTFGQQALLIQAISECMQLPLSPSPPSPYPYSPGGSGRFEANHGQANDRYPLLGRGPGYFLYLNPHETILDLRPAQRVIRLTLDGAAAGTPLLEPEGEVNYFLGADPTRWLSHIPAYREVGYRGVYPGVDLVYYRKDGHLEHDFRLAPGADATRIRWRFSGVDRVTPDGEGLLLVAGAARMRWLAPLAQQGARRIPVRYQLHPDGTVGFALGTYDRAQPLVIDPVMEYLTYLGQRGGEIAGRSTVDPQGNIILTGATTDPVYPVTPGAPLTNPQGFAPANILISKFDPTGTRLLASTYIGGGNAEMASAVATDATGNLYVTGATDSPDWPTTANAFQRRPAAMEAGKADPGNCFVAKLNPAASALLYSTFLSGNQTDGCIALAVDAAGHAYVTGGSDSPNFPTSPGAFQARPRLGSADIRYDVFVAKLSPDGSTLAYSTFVGGSGSETGHGIALDSGGHAYVTGVTNSPNFPTTSGAFRTSLVGSSIPSATPSPSSSILRVRNCSIALISAAPATTPASPSLSTPPVAPTSPAIRSPAIFPPPPAPCSANGAAKAATPACPRATPTSPSSIRPARPWSTARCSAAPATTAPSPSLSAPATRSTSSATRCLPISPSPPTRPKPPSAAPTSPPRSKPATASTPT
jgi:hypothetical protein